MIKYDKDKIVIGTEPSDSDIRLYMQNNPNYSYYTAREKLREQSYGGKSPIGQSWGDYWKGL